MTRTEQDVFNEVWTKITAQGRPGYENGVCQYRTSDGASCAIGCLIDDATAGMILNIAIDEMPEDYIPEWMRPMLVFLAKLQGAHDKAAQPYDRSVPFIPTFHRNMRAIAEAENLTVPT